MQRVVPQRAVRPRTTRRSDPGVAWKHPYQSLEERISELERQLAALQQAVASAPTPAGPTTLVSPVQVVDRTGRLLLAIEQRQHDLSIRLFNQDAQVAAALGIDGTQAGYLTIRNAAGDRVALLDVESDGARLVLDDHARRGGVVVFGGDAGDGAGGGLHLRSTAGAVSVALWSTAAGGEIRVYDGQADEILLARLPVERTGGETAPASAP